MQRDNHIDAVCGLMILWMIIGHGLAYFGLKETIIYTIGNHLFPFLCLGSLIKQGIIM